MKNTKYNIDFLTVNLNKPYAEVLEMVKEVIVDFKPTAGKSTEIPFDKVRLICYKHNIDIDLDGTIKRYIKLDDDVQITPFESHANTMSIDSNSQKTLNAFNKLEAKAIDPLAVKASLEQAPSNAAVALEMLKTYTKQEKTILTDALLRDANYLKALFKDYYYIVCPLALGKRIRDQISQFMVKVYLTEKYNDRLFAFNKDKVLSAFIVNA
jgi:hypothetical protein